MSGYKYPRFEYDIRRAETLHQPAVEAVDGLIAYQSHDARLTYEEGVAKREARLYFIDDESLYTEVYATVEERQRGVLRQMARLTIHRSIADSAPFIEDYCLETYTGGSRQAIITSTDVLRGEGVESRVMSTYDYRHLFKAINQSVRAIDALKTTPKESVDDGRE